MDIQRLNREKVLALLPDRDPNGHKGTFGKILLLCGSRGYTGAAYLAAMGALRSGAGLTFLGVPESIYAIEAIKLNEPVVFPLPEEGGKLGIRATVCPLVLCEINLKCLGYRRCLYCRSRDLDLETCFLHGSDDRLTI